MLEPSILINPRPAQPHFSTLHEALEAAAASGATLFIAQGDKEPEVLAYRDLVERASRVAQHLLNRGLGRGERVILMLPTSLDWLGFFFGTLLAGGVPVPVGPTFSFGGIERYLQTVCHIATDCGARFFVGNEHALEHFPALCQASGVLEHFLLPSTVLDKPAVLHLLPSVASSDLAVMQYTSGTTSLPKGVMLSHRALLSNAFMIGERVGMSQNEIGVSWLPLFHDMGLVGALMTSLHWRYSLMLMPAESFLMHPRRWIQWMSKMRATMTVAPNFAYQMVLDRISERHAADLDLSAWRCAFNGSEAVRTGTLRGFKERFGPLGFNADAFMPVYGMAENTLAATFPPRRAAWVAARLDRAQLEQSRRAVTAINGSTALEVVSVGTPLAGVTVAVYGEDGNILPCGHVGEITVESPSMMMGYFRNEEKTAATLRDGRLRTGDLGFILDGELYITGRAKEIIIKRGRNYCPDDIEDVAVEAGGARVLRAAAFSCPNEKAGTEDVVLLLETRGTARHDHDALDREINGALIAALGIRADATVFVPPRTISRTTSGKVQRTALRARYMQGEIERTIA